MTQFRPHTPYGSWTRCLVEFVTFDTLPELLAARTLDDSADIKWWLRNEPPVFRIDTPVGAFEPDFLYERVGGIRGLFEVKGDFLWDGPNSRERRKAEAAVQWIRAANAAEDQQRWEFALVLAEDLGEVAHVDGARAVARTREP